MKKFLLIMLIISALICIFSCGDDDLQEAGGSSSGTQTQESQEPEIIYEVGGKAYLADVNTVNIGWLDDEEITEYQKNSFKSYVKVNFGASKIEFTGENSFELTETNDGLYDVSAPDCLREENVLTKEIDKKGTINIVVDENAIVMYCDFFVNSRSMYFSLTFRPVGISSEVESVDSAQ